LRPETLGITGRGGGIRTRDPLHPIRVLTGFSVFQRFSPRPLKPLLLSELQLYFVSARFTATHRLPLPNRTANRTAFSGHRTAQAVALIELYRLPLWLRTN
jgi:hypothetical protein